MIKGDRASTSIILAGRALLVKMLITLEPRGIFSFVCLCILTVSSYWYENKKVTRLHRPSFWPVKLYL